ncbi:metallophosphoesterase [Trichloromonas sp.]|uniref:metallophosphoesterase n=1 Tax=Trichloromonas sp. TaxID=3069249 RepID=UPI003D813807
MIRLAIFLTVFLAIYAAMHALVYRGIRPVLTPRPRSRWATLIFMGLMVISPVLVRGLERVGLEAGARTLAFVSYTWMAFAFISFAGFVAVFAWDLLLRPLGRLHGGFSECALHGPRCAVLVPALALLLCIYGSFEANQLQVETIRIETDKLPSDAKPLRIVQLSDLHLGLIHRHAKLEQVVTQIERLQPDLLVATGDIVDARVEHLAGLAEIFARLTPPLGKYAITGNHEYYAGLEQALAFLQRSGFTMLRNRAVSVGPLTLAGVDDPAGGVLADEAALVNPADRCRFTLLLKHRPLVAAGENLFDLQLSGHAHRGQIVPFNLVTALEYPMQNGLYRLPTGTRLYASRGTGTWGPPVRIFSPPEITLFELAPYRPNSP